MTHDGSPRARLGPALLVLLLWLAACGGEGEPPAAPPVAAPRAPPPGTPLPPWHFEGAAPPPRRRPDPNPPQTAADLVAPVPEGRTRCREGVRERFYLLDHDVLALDLTPDAALLLPGSVEIPDRKGGERGLPLVALLEGREGVKALEVWPCVGEVLAFTPDALRAEPSRYVLLLSRQKGFKLADRSEAGGGRPVLRNVAAVRVVR